MIISFVKQLYHLFLVSTVCFYIGCGSSNKKKETSLPNESSDTASDTGSDISGDTASVDVDDTASCSSLTGLKPIPARPPYSALGSLLLVDENYQVHTTVPPNYPFWFDKNILVKSYDIKGPGVEPVRISAPAPGFEGEYSWLSLPVPRPTSLPPEGHDYVYTLYASLADQSGSNVSCRESVTVHVHPLVSRCHVSLQANNASAPTDTLTVQVGSSFNVWGGYSGPDPVSYSWTDLPGVPATGKFNLSMPIDGTYQLKARANFPNATPIECRMATVTAYF